MIRACRMSGRVASWQNWPTSGTKSIRPCLPYLRGYHVLAIESSCDDSSVCLIDRVDNAPPVLLDHLTSSLDSSCAGGIIPIDAVAHHLSSIPVHVETILRRNGLSRVDLVCATKGPGMFSSLSSGFNFAKALALAWNVPLVGVHHMLGHLLTPRFFTNGQSPQFPFLCLLTSGGHTMLVLCKGLYEHEILADTIDVAIGNALDKCARQLGLVGNMLGKELEKFTEPVPQSHSVPQDITFPNPLQNRSGRKDLAAFSFAAFVSMLTRLSETRYAGTPLAQQPEEVRREIGRRVQTAILNHLTSKVALVSNALHDSGVLDLKNAQPIDFVCSGGVAANKQLRSMLESALADHNVNFHFPDPKWCTDNALMIGWAGIEMWESGQWATRFDELPIAKWPLADLKPNL